MFYVSTHVLSTVEDITVCWETFLLIGEKAYTCETVGQHTQSCLVPKTSTVDP